MFKKCTKEEILGQITGVIGLNCNTAASEYMFDINDFFDDIINNGKLFCILCGEGNAYSGIEAQTATSSDGKVTYVVSDSKEGYTIDFPPHQNVGQKLKILKDYFNSGIFIVVKKDLTHRIYGIMEDRRLRPFKVSALNRLMPNGRFLNGTTLPINQLSFVIENENVDLNLAYAEVTGNPTLSENIVTKMAKVGSKVYFFIGDNYNPEANQKINIPTGTIVDVSMFEFTGAAPSTVAVVDGGLSFSFTGETGYITQVKPIEGIWSFNTLQYAPPIG